MSRSLAVSFDDEILVMANMTSEEFVDKTRFTMAATLWMEGKITAGQAATLCGMSKVTFLHALPKHGFPISNIRDHDLADEFEFARRGSAHG